MMPRWRWRDALAALAAVAAVILSLRMLQASEYGVTAAATRVGSTPVTVYRPADARAGPAVLVAHGFAGSQQLMQSFALAFARNGYAAITYDLAGHGRNPQALTGNVSRADGATQTLLAEMDRIAAFARRQGDGRLAVLGHSMASDIVVRYAQRTPDIAATLAVSMFSPVVTATTPRNLLVVVGAWEGPLIREALRAASLATAPEPAQPGVTYGDPENGSGRRVAISPHVEHASVLFSTASLREAVDWLDRSFAVTRPGPAQIDARGPWIALLLAGSVALAVPLSRLLPRLAAPAAGAGLPWRRLWIPLLLPPLLTPLLLRVVPTHFLPVLVGDYLAAHFALYGLLTAAVLAAQERQSLRRIAQPLLPVLGTAALLALYNAVALILPIDHFVTSFVPGGARAALLLAMTAGTLSYFVFDEWMTRGSGAARGAYAASKLAFLASLGFAIALDRERLFFLIIVLPVILLFFLVYGLISRLSYVSTGQPTVAGLANALAFAWAIAVTFPLLAG